MKVVKRSRSCEPPAEARDDASNVKEPQGNSFRLLVDCETEENQRKLYDQLRTQGFDCRVLVF